MTEEKTTQATRNPLDMMLDLVDGVVRGGLNIVSLPLGLLPAETNQQIRQTISNATTAVMDVPREISRTVQGVVDQAFSGTGEVSLPRFEEIGDRVRDFTDRMAKSAQEVGNAMSSGISGATKDATTAGGKVDEWVEKKK
jgi:hypothetical protein